MSKDNSIFFLTCNYKIQTNQKKKFQIRSFATISPFVASREIPFVVVYFPYAADCTRNVISP